jgi:general secretion pathway protein F
MANEDRLRRDLANAMTYPAFLGGVGLAAVLFIFTQVVPRFSVMIGDKRDKLPMISRWVIETGELASNHVPLLLALIGAAIGGAVFAFLNPAVRTSAYRIAHKVPLIGDLLKYREITTWARLTGFALRNGVGLLEASNLGRKATPEGGFQLALDLKAGVAVDESLGRHTTLTSMDLSLLRAGQKSGSLGKMFDFLADGYDDKLSDMMKRLTALIEPLAIGIISVLVGVVALSLVLALSSVYDTVL